MPEKKQRQLGLMLQAFYANPIARVSLELFLTIGTILFFALVAIKPTLVTMSDLVKEIEDKTELEQKLNQKLAALASAQVEYQSLGDRIERLDEAIPSSANLIELLKIIEKTCSEEMVIIESMTVSSIPDEIGENDLENFGLASFAQVKREMLSIRLTVIGNYQAIRNLTEKLRQNRRLMLVESISFNVEDNRGEKTLQATLTIETPYYDLLGTNSGEEKEAVTRKTKE